MKRYDARFDAERNERQYQHSGAARGQAGRGSRECRERQLVRVAAPEREEREERECADVHRHEIEQTGASHGRSLVLENDEQVRGDRHELPSDQEGHNGGGDHDEQEGRDEKRDQRMGSTNGSIARATREVREPVARARRADRGNRQHERAGQRIEPERPGATGNRGGDGHTGDGDAHEHGKGGSRGDDASTADQHAKERAPHHRPLPADERRAATEDDEEDAECDDAHRARVDAAFEPASGPRRGQLERGDSVPQRLVRRVGTQEPSQRRIAEERSQLREDPEVRGDRRAHDQKEGIDRLAIQRVKVHRLFEECERDEGVRHVQDDRVPHMGNRDAIANAS